MLTMILWESKMKNAKSFLWSFKDTQLGASKCWIKVQVWVLLGILRAWVEGIVGDLHWNLHHHIHHQAPLQVPGEQESKVQREEDKDAQGNSAGDYSTFCTKPSTTSFSTSSSSSTSFSCSTRTEFGSAFPTFNPPAKTCLPPLAGAAPNWQQAVGPHLQQQALQLDDDQWLLGLQIG